MFNTESLAFHSTHVYKQLDGLGNTYYANYTICFVAKTVTVPVSLGNPEITPQSPNSSFTFLKWKLHIFHLIGDSSLEPITEVQQEEGAKYKMDNKLKRDSRQLTCLGTNQGSR